MVVDGAVCVGDGERNVHRKREPGANHEPNVHNTGAVNDISEGAIEVVEDVLALKRLAVGKARSGVTTVHSLGTAGVCCCGGGGGGEGGVLEEMGWRTCEREKWKERERECVRVCMCV